jgi:hypothetical protein
MSVNFARTLSNDRLIDIVRSMDRVNNPLVRRMEGDDAAIVELMEELGLSQNIANKVMINGEVLRECAPLETDAPVGQSDGCGGMVTSNNDRIAY